MKTTLGFKHAEDSKPRRSTVVQDNKNKIERAVGERLEGEFQITEKSNKTPQSPCSTTNPRRTNSIVNIS